MGKLRSNITMSLDGFAAGPEQSETDPLGIGGMQLHDLKLSGARATSTGVALLTYQTGGERSREG